MEFPVRVDSQETVDCRQDVSGRIRMRNWMHGQVVGGADHLADFQSAAGKQHGKCPGPMVATGLRVDTRRPPELAGDQDHHTAIESAFVQVRDQGSQGTIHKRQRSLLEGREIVGMGIPLTSRQDRDERDARLDQSTGQQTPLSGGRATVSIASGGRLPVQVEGCLMRELVTILSAS